MIRGTMAEKGYYEFIVTETTNNALRVARSRAADRPAGGWPPFKCILYVLVTIISNVIYYYGLPDRRTRLKGDEIG
jgi:hypothetical protein